MLSTAQHERIARKCTAALSQAIDSLPKLLSTTDSEAAAVIVAGLIKAYIAGPMPESDPGAALAEAIRTAREEEEAATESDSPFPNS